ncbi:MAG: hypothetical protein ACI8YQ_003759 [Polaribacter sp.]|jgi:hypothetical protein
MKTKIVLWGTNEKDERVLIALQLRAQDNKVDLFTFPDSLVSEDFYNQMMDNWRNDKECLLPEGHHKEERNLSATEGLLPETLKVERGDLVQRAQTEWHFVVLSSKLNETYQSELNELKEKIEGLSGYESARWEDLKIFWSKVQNQIQERNLFREHANALRESTNGLFDHLKKLRSSLDEEFKTSSKSVYDNFMTNLGGIEEKVTKGLNLQSIFNELRNIQKDFKDVQLTREHRNKAWNKMDKLFKVVKEKRYGSDAASGNSPLDRFKKRYDGLMNAIGRMETSIKRDKNDYDFQGKRIEDSDGQLEAQIRQAKIKMIEERINSKNEKLEDMLKTKAELEAKMAAQEIRDKKNAERMAENKAKEEAKKAAKEKIAAQIAEKQETHAADSEDLKKAAAVIAAAKVAKTVATPDAEKTAEPEATAERAAEPIAEKVEEKVAEKAEEKTAEKAETKEEEKAPESSETLMSAIGVTLGEAFEDAVDTVKAIAEVVSDKVEDKIEDLKAAAADADAETPKGEE